MKVFWSWQSDTPGKTGRHFVRDTLNETIKTLKVANDIEEPSERDVREALHLDHDRKGLSGSPDLAPAIFKKISQATVFIVDVTLTGETLIPESEEDKGRLKRHINSNAAIEYGYALHALGDSAILMIQNRHYGEREDLPFDLKHKAGPLQYMLPPDATKAQIEAEQARLKGVFVTALRPYIGRAAVPPTQATPFPETPSTANRAVFFEPSEVLCRVGGDYVDEILYRFDESHIFYLRLIPIKRRASDLKVTELYDLARQRRFDLLVRESYGGITDRNTFGVITFEPNGTSTALRAFTQAFQNGELWGASKEFFINYENKPIVPAVNVENIFSRTLKNFCSVVSEYYAIAPPYNIELGAVGLKGNCLGTKNGISGLIHKDVLEVRRVLNDSSPTSQQKLINEFLDALYDLANEKRK